MVLAFQFQRREFWLYPLTIHWFVSGFFCRFPANTGNPARIHLKTRISQIKQVFFEKNPCSQFCCWSIQSGLICFGRELIFRWFERIVFLQRKNNNARILPSVDNQGFKILRYFIKIKFDVFPKISNGCWDHSLYSLTYKYIKINWVGFWDFLPFAATWFMNLLLWDFELSKFHGLRLIN